MVKTKSQKQRKQQQVVNKPKESNKLLANVPEEYVFWCCDGSVYHNLQELREALNTMSQETYTYHVNSTKNDFTNWVRDIIQDTELADALLKAQTLDDAVRDVTIRITTLTQG